MARFKLEATRGDTIPLRITIKRNNLPLDITGATFKLTGKRWIGDAVALFQITSTTILDPLTGDLVMIIPPSDTQGFADTITVHCDIEMIELDNRKTTVASGTIEVFADIG